MKISKVICHIKLLQLFKDKKCTIIMICNYPFMFQFSTNLNLRIFNLKMKIPLKIKKILLFSRNVRFKKKLPIKIIFLKPIKKFSFDYFSIRRVFLILIVKNAIENKKFNFLYHNIIFSF